MNDLMTFLASLNRQPTGQNGIPEPGTPDFMQWLLQRPQVPQYGGGSSGGTSTMGNFIGDMTGIEGSQYGLGGVLSNAAGLGNGSGGLGGALTNLSQGAGATAANYAGAGMLSSL